MLLADILSHIFVKAFLCRGVETGKTKEASARLFLLTDSAERSAY